MKRKILTLLLAGVLVFSNSALAFAEEPTDSSTETSTTDTTTTSDPGQDTNDTSNTDTQTPVTTTTTDDTVVPEASTTNVEPRAGANVTAADAVAAIGNPNILIIDVRGTSKYALGHLEGSLSLPVFNAASNSVTTEDALAKQEAFTTYVRDHKDELSGKTIYLLCNAGATGANKAAELLKAQGLDANVHIIIGGAKNTEIQKEFIIEYNFVQGATAVNAIGAADKLILDVRSASTYAAGHLKGSLSLPVFAEGNKIDEASAGSLWVAFSNYVKANPSTFAGKDIYILCNSGNSGARRATELLLEQLIPMEKIFTIEGGAKGTDDKSVPNALTYVSANAALNAVGNSSYLILDVRSASTYAAGHLKGSLSLPVFAEGNKIEGPEAESLWTAFTAYVKANPSTFAGKTIYVLCNSGSRGAVKATELLAAAGYKAFTIEGGAKNESIKAAFVTTEQEQQTNQNNGTTATDKKPAAAKTTSKSPKTGDTSSASLYLLLFAASGAALVMRKRIAR